jgi:hypothetical protein
VAIETICSCGLKLTGPDDAFGRLVVCPRCKQKVRFPKLELSIDVDKTETANEPTAHVRAKRSSTVPVTLAIVATFSVSVILLVVWRAWPGATAALNRRAALESAKSDSAVAKQPSTGDELTTAYAYASPELKLVIVETGVVIPRDDPRVAECKRLLEQLGTVYATPADEIVQRINGLALELRKRGDRANPREILEVFTFFHRPDGQPIPRRDFAEDLSAYAILRDPGRSHTVAAMMFGTVLQAQEDIRQDNRNRRR